VPLNRGINRLTPLEVKNFKRTGALEDGNGLRLVAKVAGRCSWQLRVMVAGRRVDRGIGSARSVSLADARQRAAQMRRYLLDGGAVPNWAEGRQFPEGSLSTTIPAPGRPNVQEAFNRLFCRKAKVWSPKTTKLRKAAVNTYVISEIGKRPIADVTAKEVIALMEPIWAPKRETADKVAQLLREVFDIAIIEEDRVAANPVTGLPRALGQTGRAKKRHYVALPFQQLPRFVGVLQREHTALAQLLEFTILTAARCGEARKAMWFEVDLTAKLWTVPAQRMKRGIEHRVPLSDRAIVILQMVRAAHPTGDIVFPNTKSMPYSDAALGGLQRRLGYAKERCTTHGFRSSFKDWCAVVSKVPDEVSEAALSHADKNKVRAAYLRTDYLDARRDLMEAWASFCCSALPAHGT
jgi:integrase